MLSVEKAMSSLDSPGLEKILPEGIRHSAGQLGTSFVNSRGFIKFNYCIGGIFFFSKRRS